MRRFIKKIVIFAVILAVVLGFWHYENNTIQTEVFSVASKRLPAAFDGFRLAVISDLHGRSFGEDNADLIAAVQAANPDLIALIGDIADERTDLSILTPLCEGLVDIAPCFYVTGNHEWALDSLSAALEPIKAAGVTVLANEYRTLTLEGQTIILAGVHDPCGPYDMTTHAELTAQIRETYPENYMIVLNHRNEDLAEWAALGADLVLSGHGHGGVIRLPGIGGLVGTDRSLFPDFTAGLYTQDGTTMAVSRGLGFSGVPFRLFNRPELMVIDLETVQ